MNTIYCGDVLEVLPTLTDRSVNLCVTSPPFSEQRKNLYAGVPEKLYPQWCVGWMTALKPKLAPGGSVFVNIRTHIREGVVSDYVMRTVLAIREAGWHHNETLIWHKIDAPPIGSRLRPRRAYEEVYWFSLDRQPYANLTACGHERRDDPRGYCRTSFRRGGDPDAFKAKAGWVHPGNRETRRAGRTRISDVIDARVGSVDRGVGHPAMYPRQLPRVLIETFSKPGDLVLDPFAGSGTTCLVAQELGRRYVGIDRSRTYADLARRRLLAEGPHEARRAG